MSWHIGNRAGGTYFFTVRLADAESDALVRCIADLRRAMRHTLNHHPLRIDAIAVLPAVIHTIWTLPADRAGYSNRIGMLKAKFSRSMPMPGHRTPAQIARGKREFGSGDSGSTGSAIKPTSTGIATSFISAPCTPDLSKNRRIGHTVRCTGI